MNYTKSSLCWIKKSKKTLNGSLPYFRRLATREPYRNYLIRNIWIIPIAQIPVSRTRQKSWKEDKKIYAHPISLKRKNITGPAKKSIVLYWIRHTNKIRRGCWKIR